MFKFQPGQQFTEKYTLIKRIGVGGFAEVWKVKRSSGFVQAIKIFSNLDEQSAAVASDEFERVFNLNHPRLLKASDYGVYQGHPYLVMPYCANGTAFNKAGELSEEALIKVLLDITSALAYLHGLEDYILHQDIKPDNFLIDDQGNYLLADFGISKKLKRSLTKSVNQIRRTERMDSKRKSGTTPPAYRPPEAFASDFEARKPIKASDVWSMGVAIFELATDDLPFGEYGGLIQRQGSETPNLPLNKYSKEFNEIIRWCLHKDAWERPAAQELEIILKKYIQTGIWSISFKTEEEVIEPPVVIEEEKPKSFKRLAVLFAFLITSGLGVYTFSNGGLIQDNPVVIPIVNALDSIKADTFVDVDNEFPLKPNEPEVDPNVVDPVVDVPTSALPEEMEIYQDSIVDTPLETNEAEETCSLLVAEIKEKIAANEWDKAKELYNAGGFEAVSETCRQAVFGLRAEIEKYDLEELKAKELLAEEQAIKAMELEKIEADKKLFEEYILAGDDYFKSKKCSMAVVSYEKALAMNPSSVLAKSKLTEGKNNCKVEEKKLVVVKEKESKPTKRPLIELKSKVVEEYNIKVKKEDKDYLGKTAGDFLIQIDEKNDKIEINTEPKMSFFITKIELKNENITNYTVKDERGNLVKIEWNKIDKHFSTNARNKKKIKVLKFKLK